MDLEYIKSKCDVCQYLGCWIWRGGVTPQGYPKYSARVNGQRKQFKVSRRVLELKNGATPKLACHTCDVKRCVNPEHLYDGTNKTNKRDFLERSFIKRPKKSSTGKPEKERNGMYRGKMTDEGAADIRSSIESSHTLAAKYGISPKYVRQIRAGVKWKPRIQIAT